MYLFFWRGRERTYKAPIPITTIIMIVTVRDKVATSSKSGKITNGKTASMSTFLLLDLLPYGMIS